jgi:hypothetical protein
MARKPGDEKTGAGKTDDASREALDTMMSEDQFERYLEGDSSVTRAFNELAQPEPPAALDRAILDEARNAAKPARKSWLDIDLAFWRHWAKPLSTAVIMGVCLTVVLRVMDYASLRPPVSDDTALIVSQQPVPENDSSMSMREKEGMTDEQRSAEFAAEPFASRDSAIEPTARRLSAPAKPRTADSSGSAVGGSQEEIVVTARNRSESLQEVPLAVSGLTMDADIGTFDRYSIEEVIVAEPADASVEAWSIGARPAADVWLAGIEALYLPEEPITPARRPSAANSADAEDTILAKTERDPNAASLELAKMALVYPEEARAYSVRESLDTVFEPDNLEPGSPDELADPRVWNAGIDWLYKKNRNAEAAAELAKFSKVYPDY